MTPSRDIRAATRRCLLIAVAAIFILATTPLLAGRPAIVLRSTTLRAGAFVTIGWENLPPGVEELEFFLIRGDRREEIVRLTPQLVPTHGSFRWQVPNLPSEAALLRLRVGIDGVEHDVADSTTFSIEGTGGEDRLEFREGQWWLAHVVRPGSFQKTSARIDASVPHEIFAVVGSRFHVEPALSFSARPWRSHPLTRTSDAVAGLSRAPLVVPQRK